MGVCSMRVIVRDLRPENVLVSRDGLTLKLCTLWGAAVCDLDGSTNWVAASANVILGGCM